MLWYVSGRLYGKEKSFIVIVLCRQLTISFMRECEIVPLTQQKAIMKILSQKLNQQSGSILTIPTAVRVRKIKTSLLSH